MNTGGFSPVLRGGPAALQRRPVRGLRRAAAHATTSSRCCIEAAQADWHDVEPAIFGTLLERALDPRERHKLGAHYTPRAYVERLVLPTIIEPLREEWETVRAAAVALANAGQADKAVAEVDGLPPAALRTSACSTPPAAPATSSTSPWST